MTQRRTKTAVAVAPEKPPAPNERESKAIADALTFCRSKPEPFRTKIDGTQGRGRLMISPPHSNKNGYLVHQTKTFGTASLDFANGCQGWLAAILTRRGAEGPTEADLNAALAAVGGIEPHDEVEAMLAVQMTATFETAMSMLNTAKHADMVNHAETYGNLAIKLMRTFTAQTEALAKHRRKGEQTVRVEHVHVHSGGQAIVGNVAGGTPMAGGGQLENGHQAHELTGPAALALQAEPSMLREDAGRDAMPVPSGGREGAVPQARRRQRKRSPQG